MPDPVVFISSTSDDLKEYREQAEKAAKANGFSPRMMEYFPASGHPTLEVCLEKVAEAEVVVAIVAHRYEWVPEGPENPDRKSITWLECEHAWKVTKKEVLAFLVDPDYDWPPESREDYRLVKERKKPGIVEEVGRNEEMLGQFKREFGRRPCNVPEPAYLGIRREAKRNRRSLNSDLRSFKPWKPKRPKPPAVSS